jgi:streptogramin lyase
MLPRVSRKYFILAASFLALFTSGRAHAQITSLSTQGPPGQTAADSLPNPYLPVIDNFGTMPEGRTWGSPGGVGIDSKGNVWVFERCGADSCAESTLAPILEFDPSGKLLKSFGAGLFAFPHSIFVDRDDNIWTTDADTKNGKGQQVMKFSPDGKLLMTLGKAGVAGPDLDEFNQPSGVAVAANGDIFISDGHGGDTNARIMKFSKDGKFLKTWGKKGNGPSEFEQLHGIAVDSQERVYVVDRNNSRLQVFDKNGEFIAIWNQFGLPSGIFIDKNDVIYVADNRISPQWKRGIYIGSAKDGKLTAFVPDADQIHNFLGAEYVTADSKGTIYSGEVQRKRVEKFVKK